MAEKLGKRSFLKALAAIVPGVALLSRAKPVPTLAPPALRRIGSSEVNARTGWQPMPTKEADAYFDAVSGMNAVSRGAYNYPVMLSTEHGLESYSADTAFSLNAPVLREPLLGIDAPGWQQTYERMIVSFGEPTAWAWCRDLPGVTRILPGPGKRSERDV